MFVPFLHGETPQKCVIPKYNYEDEKTFSFVPNVEEVNFLMNIRKKLIDSLIQKEGEKER